VFVLVVRVLTTDAKLRAGGRDCHRIGPRHRRRARARAPPARSVCAQRDRHRSLAV